MDKESIIKAIIDHVESTETVYYSLWTIGLTHNTKESKRQHQEGGESTKYWEQWAADSLSDAKEIEAYFINKKGIKSDTDGNLSSEMTIYVYIY